VTASQITNDRTARSVVGFTLVELMVVVAIIGLLIGILVPALGLARDKAAMVIEMSASRNLMLAHNMYAADHRGRLILGYDTRAKAFGPDGQPLDSPVNARYPWRLVPYLDGELQQTVLVHQRFKEIDQAEQLDSYSVSVMPSFGINGEFVGGTWGGPYNNWLVGVGATVTRAAEAFTPGSLIAFASARGGASGRDSVLGYHLVQPAYGNDYNEHDLPGEFGFVHPRYDNQAVVGFLDSHAATLSAERLTDMRLWSDPAARAGDPDWTLQDLLKD